ncbi:hypothetical protein BTVI_85877 [Pitangus sulphuratus]|nr:hypothetical protein BTVI_85877 [Pitangus sulphuratus]
MGGGALVGLFLVGLSPQSINTMKQKEFRKPLVQPLAKLTAEECLELIGSLLAWVFLMPNDLHDHLTIKIMQTWLSDAECNELEDQAPEPGDL